MTLTTTRPRTKYHQTRILHELQEHMRGIIWERDDMSILEAKLWLRLLNQPLTVKRAQWLGFTTITRHQHINDARRMLRRFIRAFDPTNA